MKGKPRVSVCVVTYNHEKYIRQCLQSIVDQITDFEFEVIVGDDCSRDGTRSIVMEFADKYPGIVTPLFHEKNLGAAQNYITVHNRAMGEYIAHVDGDDYCLPGKLQVQADFLDHNPDCNIVWHRMNVLYENEMKTYEDNFTTIGMTRNKYDINDIICNITIGLHSSKMYRRSCLTVPPDNMNTPFLDFTATVFQVNEVGKCACFVNDTSYGVYRSNLGVSKQVSRIRRYIYEWLLYFYRNDIADRGVINGKIIWMLLSDIRHFKYSVFYGLYALFVTILSASINDIKSVRTRMYPTSIKHRMIDEEA
jgi:glycosyltransferase involved in cell wall biosynthesis